MGFPRRRLPEAVSDKTDRNYQLTVDVRIESAPGSYYQNDRLSVTETITLPVTELREIFGILTQFKNTCDRIRREYGDA